MLWNDKTGGCQNSPDSALNLNDEHQPPAFVAVSQQPPMVAEPLDFRPVCDISPLHAAHECCAQNLQVQSGI